jgi:hypothetical protein
MSSTEPEQSTGTPEATEAVRPLDLDLDLIETDLADVDIALARLDSGEYWRDEVTGAPLDDALLARRPTARRAEPGPDGTDIVTAE